MTLRRTPGWELRFSELLTTAQRTPFQYGSFDCCLFPGDALFALSGEDLSAAFRGRYRERRGAWDMLKQLAADGPADGPLVARALAGLAQKHGVPSRRPRFERDGDVVIVDAPVRDMEQPAAGVVAGAFVMIPGTVGTVPVPRANIRLAWGID